MRLARAFDRLDFETMGDVNLLSRSSGRGVLFSDLDDLALAGAGRPARCSWTAIRPPATPSAAVIMNLSVLSGSNAWGPTTRSASVNPPCSGEPAEARRQAPRTRTMSALNVLFGVNKSGRLQRPPPATSRRPTTSATRRNPSARARRGLEDDSSSGMSTSRTRRPTRGGAQPPLQLRAAPRASPRDEQLHGRPLGRVHGQGRGAALATARCASSKARARARGPRSNSSATQRPLRLRRRRPTPRTTRVREAKVDRSTVKGASAATTRSTPSSHRGGRDGRNPDDEGRRSTR